MPFIDVRGARLWTETIGSGPPVLCLHGGWGYGAMPFDDARQRLADHYRLIFWERRGYGRSEPRDRLPIDYHEESAADLAVVIDKLGLEHAALWGHSDGAITAALYASKAECRASAIVLEAPHFWRAKSKAFFERFVREPESLPVALREKLHADHGDRWPAVIRMHSQVWLEFHALGGDFYGDRLAGINTPTLVLHGANDPHTPVREIDEIVRRIRGAECTILEAGAHSPHSEPATDRACSEEVLRFLAAHSEKLR